MMKKLFIALMAVCALGLVSSVDARPRRNCKEKCIKKETNFKQSCAPKCEERTVLTSEKWVPTMVPGRRKVKCYTTYRTCTDTSECCKEVPCEVECLPLEQSDCETEE